MAEKAKKVGTFDAVLCIRVVKAYQTQKKVLAKLTERHPELDTEEFKTLAQTGSFDKLYAKAIELVGGEEAETEEVEEISD